MVKIDYTVGFDIQKIRSLIEPNDGYTWVYYDPLGMDKRLDENGKILFKCYEKDTHEPIVVEVKNFPSTLWHRIDKSDEMAKAGMVDAYGFPIKQEVFENAAKRRTWVNAWKKRDDYCEKQIVQNQDPCDEFMQQIFWKEAQEETFNKGFQRVFFLDIETEVSETSLEPWKAVDKMLMITVYDNKTDKFYTWSLKPAKVEFHDEVDEKGNVTWKNPLNDYPKDKFVLYDNFHGNEAEMLKHFLYFWATNYPDVVCGWNSRWYDMPYIVRRIENVLGKAKARFLSPLEDYRIVHEKSNEKDENGRWIEKDEIEWVDIKGLFQADDLLLYSKKFGVKQALDGGYGLSNVGQAEGFGGKIAYETTLLDLYNSDWQKFYEYNVRDVELLWSIEKKCKLIPLARTVSGFGLVNYDYIYQSAPYLVPTISIFCQKHRENMIFNTYANNFREKVKFEGAWVIDPVVGRYSHGTATVDFNSLYPSCMRMLNLSIETYVGRIEDGYTGVGGLDNNWMQHGGIDGYPDDYVFKLIIDRVDMKDPVEREIDAKTLKKLLETRLIICPTNMTLFLKHEVKRGVIADWAEVFFNRRKATKGEMFKCDKAAEECQDPVEKEKLLTRKENLGNLQQALKICLNSIYGALSTTGCPFLHSIGLAQSVTRAGRFSNYNGRLFYQQWLKENYNVDDDYVVTASGDTDSFFMNLEAVTKDFIKKNGWDNDLNNWTDEQKLTLWNHMQKFTDEYLVPHIQALVAKVFHTSNAAPMKYGLEYMTSGGIFESPKHYIVHKIVDEGPKLVDKFKYTGIELKKAQVPPEIKKFMKDIYFTAVIDNKFDYLAAKKKLDDVYQEILKMPPSALAKWQGYGTETEMEGFLQEKKGATGIGKCANYYNQIVKRLKLDKKYALINVGDKIQTIYIKPTNVYGISQIGFPPKQWPKEFDDIFEIDYPKMMEKVVISPLKGMLKALGMDSLIKYNPSTVANLEYSIDDI